MANVLKGRIWIIDTAGATPIWLGRIKIKSIEWRNPGVIADTAVIQRSDGTEQFNFRCEVANQSQFRIVEDWIDGMIVPTLASGKLYVYIM